MASPLLGARPGLASGAVLPRAASAPSSSRLSSSSLAREVCSGIAASILRSTPSASRTACSYAVKARLTTKFAGVVVPVTRFSSFRARSNVSRSPACSPRSALVQKVTANELDSILTNERTSPMIIDFYATWCGPCVVLAQELEQLAVEYGEDIRFLKVDTDEEHELAAQMEIRGLPTMVFVSKDVDKLAIRTEGLLPTTAIRDIIEKEILV